MYRFRSAIGLTDIRTRLVENIQLNNTIMTEEKQEQLKEWFYKYEDHLPDLNFEDCDHIFNKCKQVSALVFLASKLKDKTERFFLEGAHGILYVGSSFDVFEDFTEDDVKIAVAHGIMTSDDGGFEIYASM